MSGYQGLAPLAIDWRRFAAAPQARRDRWWWVRWTKNCAVEFERNFNRWGLPLVDPSHPTALTGG